MPPQTAGSASSSHLGLQSRQESATQASRGGSSPPKQQSSRAKAHGQCTLQKAHSGSQVQVDLPVGRVFQAALSLLPHACQRCRAAI